MFVLGVTAEITVTKNLNCHSSGKVIQIIFPSLIPLKCACQFVKASGRLWC